LFSSVRRIAPAGNRKEGRVETPAASQKTGGRLAGLGERTEKAISSSTGPGGSLAGRNESFAGPGGTLEKVFRSLAGPGERPAGHSDRSAGSGERPAGLKTPPAGSGG
jgi:hypothetical protein